MPLFLKIELIVVVGLGIQYIAYTVLGEMMQIVKRGTKGKSFFFGGTKKKTSQVDIFNIIQKRPTTVFT